MNCLSRMLTACLLTSLLCLSPATHAQTAVPKALIVYDAPSGDAYEKLGFSYAIMLRNLLGHFQAKVDMIPAQSYAAKQIENYDATFYLGSYYNNPLPASFMQDVMATNKTVVWFKYNIWELAWNPAYTFTQRYGVSFAGLRGLNAAPTSTAPNPGFFDDVSYKGKDFIKQYAYNSSTGAILADPDIGVMTVSDATKAASTITIKNSVTGEVAPYSIKAGNLWYIADIPLSYIGPRDRYLVFADQLHDILGINHAENHQAMVRLEDVSALVSVANMKTLTDYLYSKKIPFSIATIPLYVDALGKYNNGVPQTIPLSQATNLKKALNYALPRGGEIIEHGYTHQYAAIPNLIDAVSADDFEFWLATNNTPVPEDSFLWAAGRMTQGKTDLIANGYLPVAWETPHYQGSALANKAAASLFSKTNHRAVYYTADTPNFNAAQSKDFWAGQFFPYTIYQDYYGQKIIPENLGNVEYNISNIDPSSNITYTWQDIYTNAQYAMVIRDGFASFFFHPFWLDPSLKLPAFSDFQKIITGITGLGYKWTTPGKQP